MSQLSADNGIYIVKFPDGFRVTHAQAIDNIDYYPKGSAQCKSTLKDYFGKSKVYVTRDDAMVQAVKLYDNLMNDDIGICEYGICYLGEYESFK
jgi:hypothetical protein